MEVTDRLKENFFSLIEFARTKVNNILPADGPTNVSSYGYEVGAELSDKATEEMNKAVFRREVAAKLISIASSLVVVFFTVRFMRDQMDPTRKEKEKAREKIVITRFYQSHFFSLANIHFGLSFQVERTIQVAVCFWRYTNSKRKSNESIGVLKRPDNTEAKTEQEKAEVLNTFFSSVFVRSDNETAEPEQSDTGNNEVLSSITVTEEDVLKVFNALNPEKSPGPDNVHPKILYEVRKEIVTPLTVLFNRSLEKGIIPLDWKKAVVCPIFKKESKKDPSNYCPVSLTSVVCKLCEKIIRDRLMKHMNDNNLFADEQYGFRPGRSCVVQLLELVDRWTESMDDGIPIDVIYLDFAKAFDRVSHKYLLYKLSKLGVQGLVLCWIKDFLSNRSQCVRVGHALSSWNDVVSGVPQGSVIGPVLFLCFINDMPKIVTGIVKILPDDTKDFFTSFNK